MFEGRVEFITNGPTSFNTGTELIPLSFKADFNNYNAAATDTLGKTIKTLSFTTSQTIYDATLYLITSNHGANSGGEEYVRRIHYVNFDNTPVLNYTPGGKSCEPYRQYNTQANGIYGSNPQSTTWWTSWNNWCPGDTISTREINLGTLAAGTHNFRIAVPAAQFNGQQGNFPLSLYLQGSNILLDLNELNESSVKLFPNPVLEFVQIETEKELAQYELFDATGKVLVKSSTKTIQLSGLKTGVFLIKIYFNDGSTSTQRLIKQ